MGGEEDCSRELQFLSKSFSSSNPKWASITTLKKHELTNHPPALDLKLSIGIESFKTPSNEDAKANVKGIQALRWHAAEQLRLAAVERAYAEQVKEMTRKEMEMAEEEFKKARIVWERAREEVDEVERMKAMSIRRISSTCAEITCRACQQRFRS